ncbi:MAG: hypothetical protein WBB45_02065 [Cyclobacteriaceae bacterium]
MRLFFYLFSFLLICTLLVSCKDDDPPSPEEQAIKDRQSLLESTVWEAVRVTNNEDPVYSYYNFTLEVDDDLMTTNDQYKVFPTTRFEYVDNDPDKVRRIADNVVMTFSDVSDSTLTISFTLDQSFDPQGGEAPEERGQQLSGNYIFVMTPL